MSSGIASYCTEQIRPHHERIEQDRSYRLEVYQQMAKEGLFSLGGSTEICAKDYLQILETVAHADAGVAVTVAVTNMVAEAIRLYGNEQQKARYLPEIAEGRCLPASFAVTEEHAGSDAANIKTTAERTGDGWVLNGEKHYITNADLSGVTIVIARTNLEAGHKGLTAFLLDRGTPGFEVFHEETKLGLLAANLVNFRLQNCHLPDSQRLGKEGQGFEIAMASLDSGRLGIAAQAVGIAQAAYDISAKFAAERIQFSVPISTHQAVAFPLADMHTEIEAARLLIQRAAAKKKSGDRYTLEAAQAKLFATEMCNRAADRCVQIHGARGYIKGHLPEKLYRDARATTIYEGTSEIQRLVIAKTLFTI